MTTQTQTTQNANNLANVPALDIDAVLFKDRPMPLRCKLERRVVWCLLGHLEANGWKPIAVFDGDGEQKKVRSHKQTMELAFNLDETTVTFQKDGKRHGVLLVFGNSPEEVVCDYGYAVGDADGFHSVMDSFNAEACI